MNTKQKIIKRGQKVKIKSDVSYVGRMTNKIVKIKTVDGEPDTNYDGYLSGIFFAGECLDSGYQVEFGVFDSWELVE